MTEQELKTAFTDEVSDSYGFSYVRMAAIAGRVSYVQRIIPLLGEASRLANELRVLRSSPDDSTDQTLEAIELDCAGYIESLFDAIKADGVVRQAKLDGAAAERDAELEQEHQRIELSNMHGGGL